MFFFSPIKAKNKTSIQNSNENQNANFAKAANHGGESSGEELIKVFLGETNQMPNFGTVNLENIQLPPNCTLDDVKTFEELYKQHCDVRMFCFFSLFVSIFVSLNKH